MKFLIIQLRQLGDVLLSSTLARAIKEHIPNSKVDFLTSPVAVDILSFNPFIDSIITLEKNLFSEFSIIKTIRSSKYDCLIDVQRTATTKRIALFSLASQKIAFKKDYDNFYYNCLVDHENCEYTVDDRLLLLKPLGIKINKGQYLPQLYYDHNVQEKVDNILNAINIKNKFFVVMPTARRRVKGWPLDYYKNLTNKIHEGIGYTPIIVVAPNESHILKEFKNDNNFPAFSTLNIKELAYLVKKADFFIGNDSFGGHVAVSQNTKAFIIIGPSSGWFPNNENTIQIMANTGCQPCNNWKRCPYPQNNGYLKCFSDLTYKKVFQIIKKSTGNLK